MKRKPPEEIRKKYKVLIKSDSSFSSHARLLQSIWREEKGFSSGKRKVDNKYIETGSLLNENESKTKKTNFLTHQIGSLVKNEINNSNKKVIQQPRIWNNLLSSQPLAFNLFGELKLEENYHTATLLFQRLFGSNEVKKVTDIEFEYSPGRQEIKYTNDGTAFDVFVKYDSHSGKRCFIGIEVKYAENMSCKIASHKQEYDEIAKKLGIFKKEKIEKLKSSKLQQFWRDHLLAGSMIINKEYDKGMFMVLYPEQNKQCKKAIIEYTDTFSKKSNTYFISITIEQFIESLEMVSSSKWIKEFKNRYLDFHKINKLI